VLVAMDAPPAAAGSEDPEKKVTVQ
jgi:hypothetical protein